ncbi:MAG: 30S ribosomal protein S13 [candidate division WOR-3 bacterium]|nr:MAG: 30S ribosomal protein S13 [candidate division WOR-3 bacterium]
MARIAGIDLPDNKKILYALPHIFGIGPFSSRRILEAVGIPPDKKVRELTEDEAARIRQEIDANYKIEGERRADVTADIKRHIEIGSYRGVRHRSGLPVRGQRTKTNARTRKGPKKSSGVVKRKPAVAR